VAATGPTSQRPFALSERVSLVPIMTTTELADGRMGGNPPHPVDHNPVRWGVLGVSNFARMGALPALKDAPLATLRAIASRSLEKATAAAQEFGALHAYGSYEELLADPEVEAVYNPLPNHLHVEWSLAALRAGKHVLCEKPIALDARSAEQLANVQEETGRIVAEAFMVHHHPQWQLVRSLIERGRIGETRAVQTVFSYCNTNLDDIRNRKEAGGGALLDIGVYAITTARSIFGREPLRVTAVCDVDPVSGCDRLTSALLEFDGGHASFIVGTQQVPHQRVHVFGTKGHIEVVVPFNAPYERACVVYVDDGFVGAPNFTVAHDSEVGREVHALPVSNQYALQWQAFSRAVRGGEPLEHDIHRSVANMRVVDALFQAARSRQWVAV
jgi:predicted dehydrogenase